MRNATSRRPLVRATRGGEPLKRGPADFKTPNWAEGSEARSARGLCEMASTRRAGYGALRKIMDPDLRATLPPITSARARRCPGIEEGGLVHGLHLRELHRRERTGAS